MAVAIFLLGLAAGSFLNRCIQRLPAGLPLVESLTGGSRGAFSPRNVLVALLTGGLFVWCYFVAGITPELAKALILTSFLILIAFIDYDHQIILDGLLAWLAGTGVILNLILAYGPPSRPDAVMPPEPLNMLIGGIIGGGLMLLIALLTRGGMGGGDIKLVAALGLWLGWQLTLLTLLLTFFLGGVGGVAVLAMRLKGLNDMIPYGIFIAAGAFIVLLYGHSLIAWYLFNYLR